MEPEVIVINSHPSETLRDSYDMQTYEFPPGKKVRLPLSIAKLFSGNRELTDGLTRGNEAIRLDTRKPDMRYLVWAEPPLRVQ